MRKRVIFFQGDSGQEDCDADAKLVASLKLKFTNAPHILQHLINIAHISADYIFLHIA